MLGRLGRLFPIPILYMCVYSLQLRVETENIRPKRPKTDSF